jgi:hypothetical protein
MPVLTDWDLRLNVDQILRGQGADPQVIRRRSPRLVDLAARALREGGPLISPALVYRQAAVEAMVHERLKLQGGELAGALLAQHLAPAEAVIIILCTIGPALETSASQVIQRDPLYGMALDGLGSAAVEALANAACARFEARAAGDGLQASIPLSPGMAGWPVEQGQAQIFDLLPAELIGVSLTPAWMMLPHKSLSMVIGLGPEMAGGTVCEYCAMRATCRYQDHYVKGA